jgi:hypothetical protein
MVGGITMSTHANRLALENAEAEHFLLTPVRWLTGLVKCAFFLLFCFATLGNNASWWLVGCGSMV